MKNDFIDTFGGLIGLIVIFIVLWVLLRGCTNKAVDIIDKNEEAIGKKIVIKNDTLLILDYSFWNDNYTLDDGRKVSIVFVDSSKLIK